MGDATADDSYRRNVRRARVRWPRVQTQDAAAALDFRITPEWVVAHWPGVSTGLAQLQLEGYRVPLVTGTARRDLAGSLTYYFTADQKLRQITFLGTTGDPRPLIDLLTTRFHLTRRVVADPGLVAYKAPGHDRQPGSSLQLRLSPTPLPGRTHRNYDIELSLVNTVVSRLFAARRGAVVQVAPDHGPAGIGLDPQDGLAVLEDADGAVALADRDGHGVGGPADRRRGPVPGAQALWKG